VGSPPVVLSIVIFIDISRGSNKPVLNRYRDPPDETRRPNTGAARYRGGSRGGWSPAATWATGGAPGSASPPRLSRAQCRSRHCRKNARAKQELLCKTFLPPEQYSVQFQQLSVVAHHRKTGTPEIIIVIQVGQSLCGDRANKVIIFESKSYQFLFLMPLLNNLICWPR
jgi:hypothetical protein